MAFGFALQEMSETLTHEEVYRALTSEEKHPVIALIRDEKDYLRKITSDRKNFGNDPEGRDNYDRYARKELGDFADKVEGLGEFSLDSLDIIRIWRELEAYDAVGDKTGEAVSMILGSAYTIAPLSAAWDGLTKGLLCHNQTYSRYPFPTGTLDSETEGKSFINRIKDVVGSADSIRGYNQRLENDNSDLAKTIQKIVSEGHQAFTTRNGRVQQDTTLGLIAHYFGNGLLPILTIELAYEDLH